MPDLTNKKIALLMGGPGSERKVSLKTAESVAGALRSKGADVVEIDVSGPDFEVPADVLIAMNLIHGTFGEDGQIQAILEQRGIRYTGAGVESSRVAFDKVLSKERFIAAGVPTPRSQNYLWRSAFLSWSNRRVRVPASAFTSAIIRPSSTPPSKTRRSSARTR